MKRLLFLLCLGTALVAQTTIYPSGSGSGSPGVSTPSALGCKVTRTSDTRLTVFSDATATTPCNVRTGNTVTRFESPATIDLGASSGTGTARIEVLAGTLTVNLQTFTAANVTCTGCTKGTTAGFDVGAAQIATWTSVVADTWLATGTDHRGFISGPGLLSVGAGLTGDGLTTPLAVTYPSEEEWLVDHFVTGGTTTGTAGKVGWAVNSSSGGGALTIVAGEVDHWGIVRTTTGTTNNNDHGIVWSANGMPIPPLAAATFRPFTFVFRTPTDITSFGVQVGLFGNVYSANVDGCAAKWNTADSDTTWEFRCCKSSTCQDLASSITPVANTWYTLVIESTVAGTWRFSLNGETAVLQSSSTYLPVTNLNPGFRVFTRTTAARYLEIDFFKGPVE